MSATRQRLLRAVARLERLRERNDTQRDRLRKGAAAMADHATQFTAAERKQILAGDDGAARRGRRALTERYQARRLTGGA